MSSTTRQGLHCTSYPFNRQEHSASASQKCFALSTMLLLKITFADRLGHCLARCSWNAPPFYWHSPAIWWKALCSLPDGLGHECQTARKKLFILQLQKKKNHLLGLLAWGSLSQSQGAISHKEVHEVWGDTKDYLKVRIVIWLPHPAPARLIIYLNIYFSLSIEQD